MPTWSVINAFADRRPRDLAIAEHGTSLTWEQLRDRVEACAAQLASFGIRRGDRLGMAIPDGIDFLTLALAAFRQGFVAVPMDWRTKARVRDSMVSAFRMRAVVVPCSEARSPPLIHWPMTASFGSIPTEVDTTPDEPALILLSSGTTGAPSGAVLSTAALRHRLDVGAFHPGFREDSRYLSCLPLCFSMGFTMALRSLYHGHAVFLHPALFSARELAAAVRDFKATYTGVVPTTLGALLRLDDAGLADLEGLREIRVSGSATSLQDKAAARSLLFARTCYGYGAAACGVICPWLEHDPTLAPECVGRPYDWVTHRVVHADGREVAPGEPGLLQVRGPGLATELITMDGKTQTLEDGWYAPGDLVTRDQSGRLHVVGRATDVIIRDGINIYPESIESAIRLHPAVKEVAVVGLSVQGASEAVIACVTLDRPTSKQELMAHCRRQLSPIYVPSEFRFVTELPRTTSGKIRRHEVLREISS